MIILLLLAVVAILIASLVYASEAASKLPNDDDLKTAKSRLTWVSVVGWLSVAVIAVLGVLFLFEGEEMLVTGSSSITYILLFGILALLFFTAWLTISA